MLLTIQKNLLIQTKKLVTNKSKLIITAVLVLAVTTTLIGIFPMSQWAETSVVHHAVQHAIIFLSGVGFGTASVAGYLNNRKDSHES